MTVQGRHRVTWICIALAILGVGAVAAYGIWSRSASLKNLQNETNDLAIPRVQLVTPTPGPATRSLTLPGNVAAWNQAPIYAQVSGYVIQWNVDYGAHVRKGDVLAEIDAPGVDASYQASRAQLETAITNYNLAELTAKRYSDIRNSPGVSQQQIDNFTAAAAAAKSEVQAAQEKVAHDYALIGFKKVLAPFDGVVTARRVNVGDYVTSAGGDAAVQGSAKPLFIVADTSKLRVYVAVPQNFGGVLSPDLTAILTLPNAPEKPIQAKFLAMADAVDPATRTIVTEFVIDEGQRMVFPGTYVDVHLTVPGAPNILVVPSQALLFRAEGMQVAKVGSDGRVRLQPVSVGDNLGLTIQVVAGLEPSDRIVASPSLGLLDGQEVKIVDPPESRAQ